MSTIINNNINNNNNNNNWGIQVFYLTQIQVLNYWKFFSVYHYFSAIFYVIQSFLVILLDYTPSSMITVEFWVIKYFLFFNVEVLFMLQILMT
jgi:hypothetical protein